MFADVSNLEARKALGKTMAAKYLLDAAVVCAVADHESSWDPWAVRFEPGFLTRYVKPVNPALPTTMEIMRSTSFGLMQIMGEVAIEHGWHGRFLTDLCDPETGMDYGCRKLRRCFDQHPHDVTAALLAYNGGGDPRYPQMVQDLMSRYW